MEDHLGAVARWTTRGGGGVECGEPGLGEPEEPVGPSDLAGLDRPIVGVVGIPEPELGKVAFSHTLSSTPLTSSALEFVRCGP
jgi:hypothetical protein